MIGQIQQGIPLPRSKRGNGELRRRMYAMLIGESFATDISNTAVHRMAKNLGIRCETRQEGRGIRVWRTA